MAAKKRRAQEANVELTPLIDVVFLLLIFFMVSTTFDRESEINITLPEASEEYTETELDKLDISIDADGKIYVNEQVLLNTQLNTIREALREAAYDLEEPQVLISADAQATHQVVVRVMDAARQLDLVKITFATTALEEE